MGSAAAPTPRGGGRAAPPRGGVGCAVGGGRAQPDGEGADRIPLRYRLRDGVRLRPPAVGDEGAGAGGKWLVVSDVPVVALHVNAAAARMLCLLKEGTTVPEAASALALSQERVLVLCERFRRHGLLEVAPDFCGDPSADAQGADERLPSVSVIVPTFDRAAELDTCLASLAALDYPRDLLEVIVVDDGSSDGTEGVARRHSCVFIRNERNRGPSYSRNAGARAASGEVLAFLDSDCQAGPRWLRELAPFFAWSRLGGVGGYVAGAGDESRLDRYEQVSSSLNMGESLLLMTDDGSMGYVPTCNLLVRRDAYLSLGGLREDTRVGEDVDFCWRLRKGGWWLAYSPTGAVRHRHRDTLRGMLTRRAAYGTSEALLHSLHPEKRKTMPLRLLPALSTTALVAAVGGLEPVLLALVPVPVVIDGLRSRVRLARAGAGVPGGRVWTGTLRTHVSSTYSLCFHLARYHLAPLAVVGLLAPGAWALAVAAAAFVGVIDWVAKRPRLSLPAFLWFSLAEHVAYQTGVLAGCLRRRSFRSYLVRFLRVRGSGSRTERPSRTAPSSEGRRRAGAEAGPAA